MTGAEAWPLALLLVLVLIPTIVGMAAVAWMALAHSAGLAQRGMKMAEEMQRHAWTAEVSKTPERAQTAATLESIVQQRFQQPPPPQDYPFPDEVALSRSS